MKKLLEEDLVSNVHSEPKYMSEFLDSVEDLLSDDSLNGGGRGKTTMKRRRNK